MSNTLADPGHGHSPAAWANVLLMIVGLSIATVGLFVANWPVLIVGAVVFIIGPIVGFVMKKAGFGINGPKYQPKAH
ncbi:HGxxPAAW family protein [Microbacterium halophytorum]|uniref:HGxxPAAW family protein n=1 Tax=Microbacterium halophytorum TaxID=2067568 RepID=UPI000CFD1725|nr:HGxxPAAW family protein [Microbacterium halophytorum]